MANYYIYELADPRDGSVFYVGKGTGNRIAQHELEASKGAISAKCDRIREIQSLGLSVVRRKVSHFSDEAEAYDAEAELINRYGLINLTNVMPGGGWVSGVPTLYEDREYISGTAEILNRTKGGSITSVVVAGQRLDLAEIIRECVDRCRPIVARRGVDWANDVAARFGVEFGYAR